MVERNIVVEKLVPYRPSVEIVERKGLGHPDSICDGIAEEISIALSKYYLDNFGTILHHNVDKGLLVGGEAKPEFGGGEVISPIKIIPAGRATKIVGDKTVPVDEIARKAAYDYLSRNFRNLDPEIDVDLDVHIRPGSVDLTSLFSRTSTKPLANDTSFGVGFYPLNELERLVLEVERFLNSEEYHSRNPWVGEDIKVMGMRSGREYKVTVAVAFVSKYVPDLDHYLKYKEMLVGDLGKLAERLGVNAEFFVNTADDPGKGDVYLTVTGLSAEAGDDGQVGRGNRANGLITPYRFMSMEATAGKNPVNHVGKLYNVMASEISRRAVEEISGVEFVETVLLSQIGKPIDQPLVANLRVVPEEGVRLSDLEPKLKYLADTMLEDADSLTEKIIARKVGLF